jgi:hypothetical protein
MRNTLFILFFLCVSLTLSAQDNNNRWFRLFGKNAQRDGTTSGYMLVRLKDTSSPETLASKGFHVARQLSEKDYVIKRGSGSGLTLEYAVAANPNWKLSPTLLAASEAAEGRVVENRRFLIHSHRPVQLIEELERLKDSSVKIEYSFPAQIVISTSLEKLTSTILPLESVSFVESAERTPIEEMVLNALDLSTNKVNVVHAEFPSLNGDGITVSVKEQRPDSTDLDLVGRYLPSIYSAPTVSSHANIMTTMIAGAGNSYYTGKGVAWGSLITSSNFANLLPDPDDVYSNLKVGVQNHSYGTAIENYYGADALAYDRSTIINPSLLHVFSAGNSGFMTSTTGNYSGITGHANLTGSFKMSKNSISVGAVDSFARVSPMSSRGPAYDGRLKPELVAIGEDGSSGAAAIVSGISLLCQQLYKGKNNGALPDASLIKAVLVNSADDVAAKGIDFISGFGNANAFRAVKTINDGNFFTGTIAANEVLRLPLTVTGSKKDLKISLAWSDPPAAANAYRSLVNDLDLELSNLSTNETWKPWVLNASAHPDSLILLPVRKRDSLNNVEQISLEAAATGNYEVRVRANNLNNSQRFSIAWQWDELNYFKWTYPSARDNMLPGRQALLRWETALTGTGELQYSANLGKTWSTVASIELDDRQAGWLVPDSFHIGMLRIIAAGSTFVTDTFTVSAPLNLSIGFNCPDSLQLVWTPEKSDNYILYHLGARYMQATGLYNDNSAVIKKAADPSLYYAVAPKLDFNFTGVKSYTLNYKTQGVGCYFGNFLAEEETDRALLRFSLSSLYNIERIELEKLQAGTFHSIKTLEPVIVRNYRWYDSILTAGINTYRLKIRFTDGRVIYSQQEFIYHFASSDFILFPNPVRADGLLKILAKDPEGIIMRLYSMDGKKLLERKLNDNIENIRLPLSRGIYLLELIKDGKRGYTGKIIVN